jgi:PAS domain S-box-containing protein
MQCIREGFGMDDEKKTQAQLIEELNELRQQVTNWEAMERGRSILDRVRDEVWKMRHPDDLFRVLEVMQDQLRQQAVDYQVLGVNVIDLATEYVVSQYTVRLDSGSQEKWALKAVQSIGIGVVVDFWRAGKVVYRPNLREDDPYGERGWAEGHQAPVLSVVDVPFSHGTLAVNSPKPDAFSPHDIGILQEIAQGLSEGFRRLEDLRQLEQRNRTLEAEMVTRRKAEERLHQTLLREQVLSRIRDQILALSDLRGFLTFLQEEWVDDLRALGIPVYRVSLQQPLGDEGNYRLYWTLFPRAAEPPDADRRQGRYPWVREAWESGKPVIVNRARLAASAFWDKEVQSILEIPISTGGSLGVSSLVEDAFDEAAVHTLRVFVGLLATALQRLQDFERLQDSEERYRRLVEQLPVGIVHTTPEGKVLYQNPSAQKMWGYSAQELSELNASVFYVHPEDHTELVNNLKEKGEHSFEYQLRRKGGQVFWGRGITKASQDKHGEVVYQGILEDITARQRAEEELRRSEEKFSKLDTPEFGVM